MKLRNLGYACMNLTLGLSTNHKFRLANLSHERLQQSIDQNLDAIEAILPWNQERGIQLFRVGSELIPFASHTQFDYDWKAVNLARFAKIGEMVRGYGMRLSMHPGQYTLLNSPRQEVTESALLEIEWQAEALEIIDPSTGVIIIHVGGMYGDKEAALRRFEDSFLRLSDRAKRMLVIENDHSTWSLDEVIPLSQSLGIPIVWDIYHHHCLHRSADWSDGLLEILEEVVRSWNGKVPKMHLSSKGAKGRGAHADSIFPEDMQELIEVMSHVGDPESPYDVMIEAKLKDQAVLRLNEEMGVLSPSL